MNGNKKPGFFERFIAKMIARQIEKRFPDKHKKITEIVNKALNGELTENDLAEVGDVPENVKDVLLTISDTIREVNEEKIDASEGLERITSKIGLEPEDLLSKVAKLYK